MPEFAAEQYVSGSDATVAGRYTADARRVVQQLRGEGVDIELVRSIFIPADETCIYLYRADVIEAVWAAAARAALRFERVSPAVTV